MAFDDDEAGFGVQPAVEAPPAVEGFGQVQLLPGRLRAACIGGLFRGGGGDEFFGDHPQLPGGQRRACWARKRFQVFGQIVLQIRVAC